MRATAAIDASRNASGAAAAAGGGGTRHSRRASMGIGRKEGIENLDFAPISWELKRVHKKAGDIWSKEWHRV